MIFREDLKTAADIQKIIRNIWHWYAKCITRGMDIDKAMSQAYAAEQGIIAVLTHGAYKDVFSDDFIKELEKKKNNMRKARRFK